MKNNKRKTEYMAVSSGTFIVIEGTDGSGKGTQFALLAEALTKQGHDVALFDFPQYSQESSYFVREYLNAKYGTAEQVGPYTASLFYALDRYQAAQDIRDALAKGKIVLANRYVGSNMGHQGTKFDAKQEREKYFAWLDELEFGMLGIPRPTMNFVLRVPAETCQKLVDQKASREYTTQKRDLHEADLNHLKRAVEVYDDMCHMFPNDFTAIDCTVDGELMSIPKIQSILIQKVHAMLKKPQTPTTAKPAKNPYVTKNENGAYSITPEGKQFLAEAITDVDGNVYTFTGKLSPITIAAAMARLSRRGDDMRVTILDEFATSFGNDDKLLRRIITAYGDDSVQQLGGLHLVVENASNLLTKKLEWGRLGAYLEQSTRYIYYDQQDVNGKYKYYTPDYLDEKTKRKYTAALDEIFGLYSGMVRQLTDYVRQRSDVPASERDIAWNGATRAQACDAIRPVLPVATSSTVGMFMSGQALESLIMHLLSDPLPEARTTGQSLLTEARKVMPTFLERADKPDRGGAAIAYRANTRGNVQDLAKTMLTSAQQSKQRAVALTDVWPRNELDLVADMLYEFSDLPLSEIREQVAEWSYDDKLSVFKAYIGERLNRRHKPGRALEKAHYSWDLLCDYGIFRDLQRHRMVDDMEWQALTTKFGYEVPKLVREAGLEQQFIRCFEISEELYQTILQAGYANEAQYATLLGHLMRWKVTYNAREAFHLHELRTSPQGHPGYRKLVGQMHQTLAQVHPLLADAMKFVNKDEDPALTRLAAERYTQFKLKQLES